MSTDFNETPGAARYRKPGGSALGQMWKNPIFKLIAIVVVIGGVGLAGVQFMQTRTTEQQSVIPTQAVTTGSTGDNGEMNPEYQRAVQQLDETRAESALGRGESALPTPMSSPVASPTIDTGVATEETRDPLRDFERMINSQQAGQPGTPAQPQIAEPQAPPVSPEVVQNMTHTYRAQMDMLMQQWTPTAMSTVSGYATQDDEGVTPASSSGSLSGTDAKSEHMPIVSAGSIYYGQMLMEANSDIPGPIMAQILTGPLAGGKAIGSFETYRNHLMIRFKSVALRGRQITVDILALDPNTTLGGVATEVDPRYFTRVILPAAAEFISAYGEAISEPTSTTTVTGSGSSSITTNSTDGNDSRDAFYKGLGSAFDSVSSFVSDEAAATKRLVRVAVGTPIALFFVNPVCDEGQACTE